MPPAILVQFLSMCSAGHTLRGRDDTSLESRNRRRRVSIHRRRPPSSSTLLAESLLRFEPRRTEIRVGSQRGLRYRGAPISTAPLLGVLHRQRHAAVHYTPKPFSVQRSPSFLRIATPHRHKRTHPRPSLDSLGRPQVHRCHRTTTGKNTEAVEVCFGPAVTPCTSRANLRCTRWRDRCRVAIEPRRA